MRVLFIVPYSTEGASNRYRIEQYLDYLTRHGVTYEIRPFAFPAFYRILYRRKKHLLKVFYFLLSFCCRFRDVWDARSFDLVFIHREACPIGPPLFEWLFFKMGKPIIYDFDDAIFLQSFSYANRLVRFFKFPRKTKWIVQWSDHVIVCNRYLYNYARRFNPHVTIISTAIDTDRYRPRSKAQSRPLTVGWIGSHITAPYLEALYPVFTQLSQRHDFILKIVGAGEEVHLPGVRVENKEWRLEEDVSDFQSLDIGVYPLPDDEWSLGKSAFKLIQYMTVGVPSVVSPIGMNTEIVKEGENAFFAQSHSEWVEKLTMLLEDVSLREKMGLKGRQIVEERFSVRANAGRLLEVLERVYKESRILSAARFQMFQRATRSSFGYQWQRFHDMVEANREHFLNYINPVEKGFFRDKVGLDAACGYGRQVYYAAEFGARFIVGVDFSDSVFLADQINADWENTRFVKGDIYNLPFRAQSFDFVYCIGAIHHLPVPEQGFHALLPMVKDGGSVFTWVYSTERTTLNIILELVRKLTSRLPYVVLSCLSLLAALVDYNFFIRPYRRYRHRPWVQRYLDPLIYDRIKLYAKFPFRVCYADWFDRLSAPIRFYFNEQDLRQWAERANLKAVRITPTGKYGWRLYGEVRHAPAAAEPHG